MILDIERVHQLIAAGETLSVEFKSDVKGLTDDNLVEAVVALANTDGGGLLQGVEDDGEVTGLITAHMDGSPVAVIANKTTPPVSVQVARVQINERWINVIQVPSMDRGIVGTTAGYYARRRIKSDGKPEDVPMGPYEILQRAANLRLIDPSSQVMPEIGLQSIDPLQRERMRSSIRMSALADKTLIELSDSEFDSALGLVKCSSAGRHLTLAGALFLTSEAVLKEHVPTYEVAFQCIDNTDVNVNVYTRKPIVEAFDDLMLRMDSFVRERELIVDGRRVPVPNYDKSGYREAIVNALVHRDYARMGAVIVKVDNTGLLISNPGGFIEGVTQDNILTVDPLSRNPHLADIAKRIGLAERTGRGVDRIFASTLRYGRPAPSYSRTTESAVRLFMANCDADLKFLEMIVREEASTRRALPFDALSVMASLRRGKRLSVSELANVLQKPEYDAKVCAEDLVVRGFLESRNRGANRTYMLSSTVYASIGKSSEYERLTGVDETKLKARILEIVDSKGKVTRALAKRECQIDDIDAKKMLSGLVDDGVLILVGRGRGSHYMRPENGVKMANNGN